MDYKIVVFDGINPDRVMFSGNSLSAIKLYLLYDMDSGNYNVIAKLKVAMARKYTCNVCDNLHNNTHNCDLCIATPLCTKDQTN